MFAEKCLQLPGKFNLCLYSLATYMPENRRLEKAIYHFNVYKPTLDTTNAFSRLYFENFLKTPWANVDMFSNLDKALQKTFGQQINESRGFLLHMTNLLTKRKRAFIVHENFMELAKQVFEIKGGEQIIDPNVSGEELVKKLNKLKGKACTFVLMDNYWQASLFLQSQGFVENVDFVDATLFLTEQHGLKVNFDTRPLVQEL